MSNRTSINKADELDILSGIWIMSCNDDNPIMTYRSIAQRLNLSEKYDIISVVRGRPELFRQGILKSRLDAWKDRMKSGKNRPNWIVEIRNSVEQHIAIDHLTRDDVFRSQFRVEDDAPKSDIKTIEWGLQHIDRLRKAAAEEREEKSRRWTSIIIPLASLFVAVVSVIASASVQRDSTRQQTASKRYEVEFAPKQRGYSTFMNEMMLAAISANAKDEDKTLDHINQMETAYYLFEPFLNETQRTEVFQKYREFANLCSKFAKADHSSEEYKSLLAQIASIKTYYRIHLFTFIFAEK